MLERRAPLTLGKKRRPAEREPRGRYPIFWLRGRIILPIFLLRPPPGPLHDVPSLFIAERCASFMLGQKRRPAEREPRGRYPIFWLRGRINLPIFLLRPPPGPLHDVTSLFVVVRNASFIPGQKRRPAEREPWGRYPIFWLRGRIILPIFLLRPPAVPLHDVTSLFVVARSVPFIPGQKRRPAEREPRGEFLVFWLRGRIILPIFLLRPPASPLHDVTSLFVVARNASFIPGQKRCPAEREPRRRYPNFWLRGRINLPIFLLRPPPGPLQDVTSLFVLERNAPLMLGQKRRPAEREPWGRYPIFWLRTGSHKSTHFLASASCWPPSRCPEPLCRGAQRFLYPWSETASCRTRTVGGISHFVAPNGVA